MRLVKTIGDAAMLASPEPEPLLEAALALIEGAEAEGGDFPQLRAGAAFGPALARAGDWFGAPVNLASRITAVARPGSLLVDAPLYEAVGSAYRASFAGERRLKGIREPVRPVQDATSGWRLAARAAGGGLLLAAPPTGARGRRRSPTARSARARP